MFRYFNVRMHRDLRGIWLRLSAPLAGLFAQAPSPPPEVAAKAVYCLDVERQAALLEKNARFKFPPASTIKLATALVLLRAPNGELSRLVVIESGDLVRGSNMGLRAGDVVTRRDLLHGLLLASGNDAAQAIARSVGRDLLDTEGSNGDPVARFVQAMNQLAANLGLGRTRFANPSGLPAAGQYSTALDLALLGAEAFADPIVQEVSRKHTYVLQTLAAPPRRIELRSTMELLGEEGIVCGKTGTAEGAGACLVLYSLLDGRPIVTVLLATWVPRRYEDARRVLARLAGGSEPRG